MGFRGAGFLGDQTQQTESSASDIAFSTRVAGDSNPRWQVLANGEMDWGPGNAAVDSPGIRRTASGLLEVGQDLRIMGRLGLGISNPDSTIRELLAASLSEKALVARTGSLGNNIFEAQSFAGAELWSILAGGQMQFPGLGAPAVAPSGKGRAYFDSTLKHLLVSEDGGAFFNMLGLTKIEEKILSADTTNVTFSSIPQIFRHLVMIGICRSSTGSATGFGWRGNGDTTANYDSQNLDGSGATASASESLAATRAILGEMPPSGAQAGGPFVAVFPDYAATRWEKSSICFRSRKSGTATGNLKIGVSLGTWRGNGTREAITSITLRGDTGDIELGAIFSLFGVTV